MWLRLRSPLDARRSSTLDGPHSVEWRIARAGDKLVVASFAFTWTCGLAARNEPSVAADGRSAGFVVLNKNACGLRNQQPLFKLVCRCWQLSR